MQGQLLFIIIEAFFGEVFTIINNTYCVKNAAAEGKRFFEKRNLGRKGGGNFGAWRKDGAFL